MPVKSVAKKKTVKSTKKKQERLILLDAHAIIHRAYHALPDFQGPSGEPTGALYGLAAMLLKIIQDLKPDYLAAAYDLPKPTVRHEAYEGYKSTRAKIDDALTEQLTTSRKVFKAFGIPIYDREGFEADDILGTVTDLLKGEKDLEIVIASGDMDTLQLVDGKRVRVYTLKRGLNDTIMYDEAAVKDRYGFAPKHVADFKGLRGDPSDNIIGVPGVGEKTATTLIQAFGTIERIYVALKKDEEKLLKEPGITPRMVNLLKEHEEDARFSKMLATIRTDAPIAFTLSDTAWKNSAPLANITVLFDELGFRTLRERARAVLGGEEAEPDVPEEANPELLAEAQVMTWLLCSDMTNPSQNDVLAFAKAGSITEAHKALLLRIESTGRLDDVYEEIENPLIPVLREMERYGVLIDKKKIEELRRAYSAELADVEKKIHHAAGKELNVSSPKQLADVLYDDLDIKAAGARGHKKTSTGQRSTKESELEKLRDAHPIINDVLEYRQIKKLLGTYIENIPPLLDTGGRLHAEFLQTGTTTGRIASQSPNLQNIPIRTERGRAIRHAFTAPKGSVLLGFDYSQIELRIAAMLSGDEKLSDIFRSGRDVHQEVAAAVFNVAPDKVDREMRRRAKIINFGILYGMGVNALRVQLGTSIKDAHQFYDDYFQTFSRLAEYLEETKGYARRYGFTETLFGRRREFLGMKSPLSYVRAQAERMAINAPIQGTQADIIKLAMVRISDLFKKEGVADDTHMTLQVHDELVFEIAEKRVNTLAPKIKEVMETVIPEDEAHGIPVIAEGKQGPDWGSMTPLT